MFKSLLCCLVVICGSATAAWAEIPCAPRLRECVDAIQQLPEARRLIERIQQEGPIQIALNDSAISRQFGAFWDVGRRTIYINPSAHKSEGEIIGSILFELHNAATTYKFDHYDHLAATGQIDKSSYIKSMEFVEYENSIKTAEIADKGISLGIFPRTARLPTYRNFDDHFYFQQVGGHSACFERIYNRICPKYSR